MLKCLPILFVEDLDRLDCAIWHPHRGVEGETFMVDVTLQGPLDERGFIHDFGDLKRMAKAFLKETLDHTVMVPEHQESFAIEQQNHRVRIKAPGGWAFEGPSGSVSLLPCEEVSSHHILSFLDSEFSKMLPKEVSARFALRHEPLSQEAATFCYTHGITGHLGDCQRIFHGHRSRIMVFENNRPCPELAEWVKRSILKPSLHIANQTQVEERDTQLVRLTYQASQGLFWAEIPAHHVLITQDESTSIEHITHYVAQCLQNQFPNRDLVVRCYEGIGKGAQASTK